MNALLRKLGSSTVIEGELIAMPEIGTSARVVTSTEGGIHIFSTSTVESVEKLSDHIVSFKTRNSKYLLYLRSEAALLREV